MRENEIHVIYETLAGSRLYGTHRPDSDYDWRGVAIPPFNVFFGSQNFDQLEEKAIDRVIYGLSKFATLAADANPNIVELLFAPREFWKKSTPTWERIIQNRNLFISTKCKHTFLGYAFSQLKRIKTHKKWIDSPPQKPDRAKLGLSVESKIQPDALKALKTIPTAILGGNLSDAVKKEIEYELDKGNFNSYRAWKESRNPARAQLEIKFGYDTKHGMHLVRLLHMGEELLKTGKLNVSRIGVDADLLNKIREGLWSYEKLIEYAEEKEALFEKLYTESPLPEKPNRKKIEELLISIYCEFFSINYSVASQAVKHANQEK